MYMQEQATAYQNRSTDRKEGARFDVFKQPSQENSYGAA
jgi:hypothetical protein